MQNFIAGNTKTQSIEDYIGKTNTSNLQATSEQGNDFARILGLDKDNSRNYTDRTHHEKNNTKTLYDTENKYEKTDRRDSKEKNAPRREGVTDTVKNNGAADYNDNSKTTVDKVDSKPVIKEAKETLEGANTEVLSADDAIKQTAEKIDNLIENSLTGQLDMADVEEIKNVLNEIKAKIDNGKLVVNEDTKQALNNIINRLLTQNPKDFEVDALIKDFKQLAQDIQANTFKTNSQVKLEEEASNPLKALEVNVNTEDTNTPEVKDKKIVNEEKNTLKTKEAQTNIQVNSEVKEVQKSDSASEKADIEQEMLEEMDVKIEEVSGSSTSSSDTSEKNFTTAQDEVIKLQIENAEADTSTPVTFAFDRSIKNANAANNQIRLEGIAKELNTNDILNQIGSKFEQLKDGSSTKLTMTLRPNDLGRVTIELLSNANGISTNIIAQNSQVKELLDKNIDILKQQLAQQGINVQNIQVKTVEQNAQASLNNSFGDRGQGEQDTNNNRENKNPGSRQNDSNKHGEESYKFNQSNVIENIDFENNSRGATASINTLRGKISYNL
ncbi:TPA: flagellar hook-length control protein FliK [Candidatus Galligastranaerophilus faecipullorum]|nr:flagellar hook-length control protein FliK [Candidatus Galligastranaerophilus faecipullorum]